jgi:hypothetical protein
LTVPPDSNAQVELMPAEMSMASVMPDTVTGDVGDAVSVPSPKGPLPQHLTVPPDNNAQA